VLLAAAVVIIALAQFTDAVNRLWSLVSPEPERWQVRPLRVRYTTLEGHALSLFVLGELEKGLEEALNTLPVISQNEVYHYLENIHKQFAYPRKYASYFEHSRGKPSEVPIDRLRSLPLCPGTFYAQGGIKLSPQVSPAGLIQDEWSVRLTTSPYLKDSISRLRSLLAKGEIDVDQIEFQKFLSREEALGLLEKYRKNEEREYFAWLTRNGAPRDLFFTRVFFSGCDESFVTRLEPLRLKLRVLILENLLDEPVKLTDRAVSTDEREGLRPESEFRAEKEPTLIHLVADDILNSGESAIVPLRLFLSGENSREDPDESDFHSPVVLDPEQIQQLESSPGEIKFVGYRRSEIEPVPAAKLVAAVLDRPLPARQEYLVGPALEAISVAVNERLVDIRPMQVASINIYHGYNFGSCPHVYVITGEGARQYCGKLLTGLDATDKRGWYFKSLPPDTRSVVIVERDPEVTYLDALRITAKVGRTELLITPEEEALRHRDGVVRILERGGSLEVAFPGLQGIAPRSLLLEAFGHYEPLAEAAKLPELRPPA